MTAFDIEAMKAEVGFDPDAVSTAFSSKWAEKLDDETNELLSLFEESRVEAGFSKKSAASYKSLVTRYLATKAWSVGKSGDSQKSAVRAFIRFVEAFTAEASEAADEIDELEELDETVDSEA